MPIIRVLLADDDVEASRLLGRLLGSDPGIEIVGTAIDAAEAIALADTLHPDVAVLDVHMPGGGPRAAQGIRNVAPGTKVLALSASDDRHAVLDMLREGALGYLLKGAAAEELLASIRSSARGERVLSASLAPTIVDELVVRLPSSAAEDAQRVRSVLDRIAIVHQPIVDLRSRRVLGLEALARFPEGTPDAWFAIAAACGELVPLELACIEAALRIDMPAGVYHSINVSPRTLMAPGFDDTLRRVDLRGVVLEITEHTAVEDYEALDEILIPLRTRGLRLAIDDAGAGFSNLQHILRLTPELIKIDRSLTSGIDRDRHRRALASALLSFSLALDASVVAEGIETDAELEALVELGISEGQGYLLGRPSPLTVEQIDASDLALRSA